MWTTIGSVRGAVLGDSAPVSRASNGRSAVRAAGMPETAETAPIAAIPVPACCKNFRRENLSTFTPIVDGQGVPPPRSVTNSFGAEHSFG